MRYYLGSMFFLAMLVALRIMPLYAEEATVKASVGGTDKFQDITGGGDFQMHSDVVEYVVKIQEDSVEAAAIGAAEWPALTYKLP